MIKNRICTIHLSYKINNNKNNDKKCDILFETFQNYFIDEFPEATVEFTMLQKANDKYFEKNK